MDSIWSKNWPRVPAGMRELPERAEVVIVGGGMAGLLCAYLLKQAGIKAVVLEAETVCSGQTKNTTAKITSQHGLIYDELTKTNCEETARRYGRINERAIDEFERIIKRRKIACGFERLPSFLYTKTEAGEQLLRKELIAANKAGIRASIVHDTELPFAVKAALKYENQAQFHPLEFIAGIIPELNVFEHTRVGRVKDNTVETERGSIRAGKVVFATHYPFVNFPGFYFARMHQERSYVVAVKAKDSDKRLNGMYYGIDPDGLSFRSAEELILISGKSERTGIRQQADPYALLKREAAQLWPDCREEAHWAAQDCMTLDKLPYIGRYSKLRPDWYVATGFEKWGMTNSMIAAMAICDMITGRENPDWQCVSPQRKLSEKAIRTFLQEMVVTTRNFVTWKKPRCPHLGCRLVWNPYERTWDCPCHGSRFSDKGELIDNPAQCNAKIDRGIKE